ncbi:hypothetical protein BJY16_007571 [Actinoplanes octamycinicus]|uniref:Polyketide cyclase/dehydrase/lipid transport protein n=1 Tax=Actinoplanes octamycinicus TaxID=135948 RepID=A0A7W7H5N1_9ACTN|nr:SRPBCC family protein [Actinoplanes octamycinicus]MBB4744112.1 hypothetical protein [Actinoplanes octamycinicus]GIE56931.1 hypothetical protein Aoc01nite_23330 [Actinoplanes octamycinicus]
MRFDIVTKASPEQAYQAFTDFSDRRVRIWHRTLDAKKYELRDQGDTWAVAREGSARSPFWVVVRYDLSAPPMIRWTVLESSYGGGGDGFVRIAPADGGGSRIHAEWTTANARLAQRPLLFLIHHGPLPRMVARMWTATLDQYAGNAPG